MEKNGRIHVLLLYVILCFNKFYLCQMLIVCSSIFWPLTRLECVVFFFIAFVRFDEFNKTVIYYTNGHLHLPLDEHVFDCRVTCGRHVPTFQEHISQIQGDEKTFGEFYIETSTCNLLLNAILFCKLESNLANTMINLYQKILAYINRRQNLSFYSLAQINATEQH
jgi:hypothetical protein